MVLKGFLKKLPSKPRVLILTHAGTDVDALASAFALFDSLLCDCTIGFAEHLNQNAAQLARALGAKPLPNPNPKDFDGLILVDFNSFSHAGRMENILRSFGGPVMVLDHHEKEKDAPTTTFLHCDPTASATAVLVFHELQNAKIKPTQKALVAIAAGILADTAFLHQANLDAIQTLATCLAKSNTEYNALAGLFTIKEPLSERIAKLRSAHRMRLLETGDFLIALSHVNYFESEAAAALVTLGADVAFVAGIEHNSQVLRLNGRARSSFLRKTKVNLALLAKALPDYFGGHGNGHAGAAGFNAVHANVDDVLQKSAELLTEQIKKLNPKLVVREIM